MMTPFDELRALDALQARIVEAALHPRFRFCGPIYFSLGNGRKCEAA